jgi:Domain of unknown function (DUF4388)
MDQLKGSLRFIPLPAVTQFVAGLGNTGRLKLTQGAWSGEIALRDGQIVSAQLGADRSRAALEGMVLALTEADFAFVDGPVEATEEPVVGRDEITSVLAGLASERERLQLGFGSLGMVPCLVDQEPYATESSQVTINAAALQLIPALVHGHTLEQIAQRRGLARTLREVSVLRAGGLVRLEAAPAPAVASAPVAPAAASTPAAPSSAPEPAPAAAAPAPAAMPSAAPAAARPMPPVVRPLRPVNPPAQTPQSPRRPTWWQTNANGSAAPAQAPVELSRPRLVTDNEPRVAQSDTVRDQPEVELVAQQPEPAAPGRGWRQALVGLFVAEPTPQA